MSKLLKERITQDLQRRLGELDGYILVDFRGLNSAQSYDLRRALHQAGVQMSVVPNRLALRILDRWEGRQGEFRGFFRGPTALVYGEDGPLSASRVVSQWKKKNKDLLAIKGGVLGGQVMPPAAVETLARIPERPQLLAQVAGTFQAPLTRLAAGLQQVLGRVVYALEAYRKKREESSPAGAGGEGEGGGAGASPAPETGSSEAGSTAAEAAAPEA
jgi:large subunit ribosomal protein L10